MNRPSIEPNTSESPSTPPPAHGQVIESTFRPAWWLAGAHRQTLWPHLFRSRALPPMRRERIELPDGDFVDVDWTAPPDERVVLVLHGLEGSVASHYAAGLLRALHAAAVPAAFMHFRGCSGEPNRLARSYNAGDTADLAHVAALIRERHPAARIAAVGYSLGGNVLMKWLGENGADVPLAGAIGVSVPFVLSAAADRLDRGASRLYQAALLRQLRRSMRRKFAGRDAPIDLAGLDGLRDFWEFDDRVTAPLHGFAGADDYYRRSSCRRYLAGIRVPALIVHARDDPFTTLQAIPEPPELSPTTTLELADRGGHVGFVAGRGPLALPHHWLEPRILEALNAFFSVAPDSNGEAQSTRSKA